MKNRFSAGIATAVLALFLLTAGSVQGLFAGDLIETGSLEDAAESMQIISFSSGYPGYRIFTSFTDLPPVQFRPWTAQLRVSGFAAVDSGVVIGINSGAPLLMTKAVNSRAELGALSRSTAERFLTDTAGLTTGTVYSEAGSVFFHLYRDSFFSTSDLPEQGVQPVLLELSGQSAGASRDGFGLIRHDFGFQSENRGWEPVEYIRKNGESLISWKYSDEKKTRFRYIRHNADGVAVDEIDEKYFRDEYNINSIESGPFALRGFNRAVRDGSLGSELAAAGDLYLRLSAPSADTETGIPVFYHSGAPKAPRSDERRLPVQLSACPDDELWYILVGENLFVCGANVVSFPLPGLPDGFDYEDIWVDGRDILISWEESRFPYIGRSGMIYVRLRDILN